MRLTKITLLMFIILTGISCSNSDKNETINPPENSLKKVSETTYTSSIQNFSANFNYTNGILTSISDDSHKIEITYNNNKISSTAIYANNILSNSYAFNYHGGLLESITNSKNNFERTFYTYDYNNSLSTEEDQSLINNVWKSQHIYNYTFTDGNVSNRIATLLGFGSSKNTYDYDNKLNPMNYMSNEVRELIGLESCDFKSKNNQLKQYKYSSSTSTTPILDFIYQITYNDQNLPTSIKKYQNNAPYSTTNTLVSEATFEYN